MTSVASLQVAQHVLGRGALAGGQDGTALQICHGLDRIAALFHYVQHAKRVDGNSLNAALRLLIQSRSQICRDGSHVQLALHQQGHDLIGGAVELQVVVHGGGAVGFHAEQVDQTHGGGALQARDAQGVGGGKLLCGFAGSSLGGSGLTGGCRAGNGGACAAAAGCQAQRKAERQQQRYKFLHDVLFLPAGVPFPAWEPVQTLQCKILQGKFAKIFALRVLVYYNRGENTVAHATELQEDCGGRCGSHGVAMKNDLPLLQSTTLFSGLSAEELQALLTRLGAVERSFGRGEVLVLAGAPSRRVGVVLSGELEAYRPGPEGARVPITRVEPGGVFGDVLGGSSLASPVTVLAATACEVLLVPYEQLLLSDGSPAHQRVLQNLVRTISDKYFLLSRRVDLLVLKSLRAKVCAYLLNESERAGSLTFSIPFSRVQLADYLNCDRSALSRELSLMQKDGLLDTFKSSFKLLDPDALKQMVQ